MRQTQKRPQQRKFCSVTFKFTTEVLKRIKVNLQNVDQRLEAFIIKNFALRIYMLLYLKTIVSNWE